MLATGSLALGLAALPGGAAIAAAPDAALDSVEATFGSPSLDARPMARMWFPDAGAGADEEGLALVEKQIRDMAREGFGGVEVSFLADTSSYDNDDAAVIGWGTDNWQRVLKRLLTTANSIEAGFKVDITITSHWPPIVNSIDPNDDEQQQEAAHAYRKITADDLGAVAAIPLPEQKTRDYHNEFGTDKSAPFLFVDKLSAATVVQVESIEGDSPVFDLETLTDVTDVTGEQMDGEEYTGYAAGVPDEAYADANGIDYENEVVAKFGPEPADPSFSGKIDDDGNRKRMADWQHIYETDLAGVAALDGYEPSEGDELAAGDWVLFGSYHHGTGQVMSGGASVTIHNRSYATDYFSAEGAQKLFDFWDDHILDDEMIALLKENGKQGTSIFEDSIEIHADSPLWTADLIDEMGETNGYDASAYAPILAMGSATSFDDVDLATRILEDKNLALGELYETEHASLISDWTSTFDYTYRAQAYTLAGLDIAAAAAAVDIPEGDNSTSGDGLRNIAAAVNLADGSLLSMETTTFSADINSTWQTVAREVNRDLSHGVNRSIFHGSAFARTFNDYRDDWPGWNFVCCGNRSFSSYNARQIWWDDADTFSGYVARSQAVMQAGEADVDLAVLLGTNTGFQIQNGNSMQVLLDEGFSYNLLSEALLDEPSAVVDGGVLAPDGPAYDALIVRQADRMSAPAVQKLADYADAGLPVILYDSEISRVYGTQKPGNTDADLAAAIADLTTKSNVAVVDTQIEVAATLAGWGIEPDAQHEQPELEASHRADGDVDYYYLYNANGSATMYGATVSLAGTGKPYALDAWTGEVTPITEYRVEDGRVTVTVDLEQRDAAIIALVGDDTAGGLHAESLDGATAVFQNDNTLVVRTTEAGSYAIDGSGDKDTTIEVAAAPAPVSLSDGWSLTLESWGPDPERNDVDPTLSSTETVTFDDIALGSWSDLPATSDQLDELGVDSMNDVSGIGWYTKTFTLPKGWTGSVGSLIEIGHSDDMIAEITVNGKAFDDVDHFTGTIDAGSVLHQGTNTIEIKLDSTLGRRMVAEGRINSSQSYGLQSVSLVPYVQTKVSLQGK
ncbi:glycosyl hydrolase [Microbacterium thalassium]|uniref:Uncharacterized protein n=1 Tax=Microbacterium thalassium TaxID=362649 RepID=A0A7X0FN27_9MICO|nr:glycosyl hydrolase [Microbacterium thalassium]MBB6390537.1 hypothetical protein [Microbacterium thalassium]